jgi:hypothetical protein
MAQVPTLNTDLTGLFNIQKDYLAGLAQQSEDPELSGKITTLQQQLDKLYTDFKNADVSSSAVLAKQKEMSDIINAEKERLLQKKQSIDNALVGKKRAVALNEAYRMRQAQYTRIKVVIVIVLAICIFLVLLGQRFPIVPLTYIILLNTIVVLVGGIYCLFLYSTINSRSMMNYDELNLQGPSVLSPADVKTTQAAAAKVGDLLGTVNVSGCVGSECCSTGTKWDNKLAKCVPNAETPTADTTIPKQSAFTTMSQTLVHSPSEYDSYGKV